MPKAGEKRNLLMLFEIVVAFINNFHLLAKFLISKRLLTYCTNPVM